jgi:WD40 repeat protein
LLKGHIASAISLKVSPDGQYLVSGGWDGTVRVWDMTTWQSIVLEGHQFPIVSVTITSDGQYVISGSADQTLRIWDIKSGRSIASFTGTGPITHCVINALNEIIAVGEWSGTVHFLHPENLQLMPPVITPWKRGPGDLAFGCPYCRSWSNIPEVTIGNTFFCPTCGNQVKFTSFTIQGDWQSVAKSWSYGKQLSKPLS